MAETKPVNYGGNPSMDSRQREKVRIIPIEYIDDFPDHPFKVVDDESMDTIFSIMTETKPNQVETIKFKSKELSQYFPANTPPETMRKFIFRLLEIWQKSKEKKEPVTTGAKQGEAR